MPISAEITAASRLLRMLDRLNQQGAQRAVKRASKRAATAARTAGTKAIRNIYTIKSGNLKARTQIRSDGDGTTLLVRGSTEPVSKYKAALRQYGVFVAIKRSGGGRVARSFMLNGNFMARVGKERYPVKGLYGPAVPQLFGNPDVMEQMQERGGEMFGSRLEHELDRLLGGA
ncbi:hypothetical protein [Acidaminococcus sp.]|uniref:hypothetical protein n=1 Tax=Acidaminococcus sp. TaxID=1872103 RepID=UPI003D7DE42A